MEQEKFPESVVIQCEKEQKAHELRRIVRTAQDAFCKLRDDVQFVMPSKLSSLTIGYCKEIFEKKRQQIEAMVVNEDIAEEVLKKQKLFNKARARHMAYVKAVGEIRAALDDGDLRMIYDQSCCNIVPTGDIEAIAAERVSRPVPYLAADQWRLLQVIRDCYNELRRWESERDIRKLPLKQLFSMDVQRFAETWAQGGMFLPPDEPSTIRAMREASEKQFV